MKQVCSRPRCASRGIGLLIELLVVVVIIAALTGLYLGFSGRGGAPGGGKTPGEHLVDDSQPQSVPGRALQKAVSMECQSNLRQLRTLVEAEKSTEGAPPASLRTLPEAASISTCPVGGEAYTYDPATGAVHCPHPGHEGY